MPDARVFVPGVICDHISGRIRHGLSTRCVHDREGGFASRFSIYLNGEGSQIRGLPACGDHDSCVMRIFFLRNASPPLALEAAAYYISVDTSAPLSTLSVLQ